jgi:AcrR family transcriptional regulator
MTTTARGPRKDQLRNRQRLLDAASDAFAEQGPDISIEAIARRAGVGATTFYRHFPTKEDLVEQLLDHLAEGARQVAARAAAISDDWEAFRTAFTQGCVLDDARLALFDALCRTSARAAEQGQRVAADIIAPATERAQRSGLLRPDITADDIAAFMRMADSAPTPRQRRKAQEVLLAGIAAALRGEDEEPAPAKQALAGP